MSALFIRSSISVGASGALFGLIGSMLSELITNWTLYANKVSFPIYPSFNSNNISCSETDSVFSTMNDLFN
jgi:membrane associated rhomboid family serine protease